MRKFLMIFAIASLLIWVPYGNASVQVQLFDQTFVRGAGLPSLIKYTFPSSVGQATIEVYNGDNDPTTRESSAVITLNKKILFYQSMFSNKIKYLKNTIALSQGQNNISVLLTGKPGSKIRIRVLQQVEAEAVSIIGPSGGVVEVTNSSSPLLGVKIEIPQGTASNNAFFNISLALSNISPPDPQLNVSQVIRFDSSLPFDGCVFLTIPINVPISEGDSFAALYFDEQKQLWLRLNIIGIDIGNNSIVIATTHFTNVVIQKAKELSQYPNPSKTDYKYNRDRFHPTALNTTLIMDKYHIVTGGLCDGFTQFSLWYYLNKLGNKETDNYGLSCRWTETKAINVAYKSWDLINHQLPTKQEILNKLNALLMSNASTLMHLIDRLDKGQPEVLLLAQRFSRGDHSLLVYDYKIESKDKVIFKVYEPGLNKPQELEFIKGFLDWDFNYKLFPEYDLIAPNYLGDLFKNKFEEIYNGTYRGGNWSLDLTPDNWCIDSDKDGIYDNGSGNSTRVPCAGGNIFSCDDNCLNIYNPDQKDSNGDGVGDACSNSNQRSWNSNFLNYNYTMSLAYGNGKFVAVGYDGLIITSQDGVDWVQQISVTELRLFSVAFGNGRFVAVGENGIIITSTNGLSWSIIKQGGNQINRIKYLNNKFLAVGLNGIILLSSNGIDWISSYPPVTCYSLSGIAFGNGKYVVAGYEGLIFTSYDGVTWNKQVTDTKNYLTGITYGDGKFIAVGENNNCEIECSGGWISRSSDGIHWNSMPLTDFVLTDIIYDNGEFIAGGYNGVHTSKDGNTWTMNRFLASGNLFDIIKTDRGVYAIGYTGEGRGVFATLENTALR